MEWISVDDRLPTFNQDVLVYNEKHDEFDIASVSNGFEENQVIWIEPREYCMIRVTHWMPLPEKPGEE